MKNLIWTKALKACADPQRAKAVLDRLASTSARAVLERVAADQVGVLAALFAGSQAMSDLLLAHPDWLALLDPELVRFPRRKQGLQSEVAGWLKPLLAAGDFAGALARVREFKQQQMLRIATRDLGRLSNAVEITQEISDVADVCLDTVGQVCWRQLTARFGPPYHQDAAERWLETKFCVLGLGKLGGQELNYSSDVDVL
jgi:[glutamine synthetase] adenylyltransferase / [glutamine synthetase]-adenylyl-L-tyrosine phosphorylase